MGRAKTFLINQGKYAYATSLGAVVEMAILWLLAHVIFKNTSFSGKDSLSILIASEIAILVNFTTAYFFVWRDRITKRSARSYFRHYLAFALTANILMVLKVALALFFKDLFRWDVVICDFVALIISGTVNFVLNEMVIFKDRKQLLQKYDPEEVEEELTKEEESTTL